MANPFLGQIVFRRRGFLHGPGGRRGTNPRPGILTLPPGRAQAERINGDVVVRLALRARLADLDDIRPPTETKELGEKITASPVAAQLVDRIRDVMRRRRLTAPEVDGAGGGIEPN